MSEPIHPKEGGHSGPPPHQAPPPYRAIIVMGVSGCGKTTIGKRLADRMGGSFLDADDFHSPSNLSKMGAGIPLTDDDRVDWLRQLRETIDLHDPTLGILILACSALKKAHRDQLRGEDVAFIQLVGSRKLLKQRLEARTRKAKHFMPPTLLDSQIDTLESPVGEPRTWSIGIDATPAAITEQVLQAIRVKGLTNLPPKRGKPSE